MWLDKLVRSVTVGSGGFKRVLVDDRVQLNDSVRLGEKLKLLLSARFNLA